MSRKTENVTFDAGALEFYNAPSDSYDNDEGNEKENVGVKKSLWSKMSSSSRYVSLNENKVNRSKKDPCQSTSLFGEKNHWDVNPSQDAKKSKKISLKKGIKNLLYPLVVLMIFSTIPLTAGNILPKADRSIWFSDLTQLDSSSKSAFDYLGIEYIDVPGSLVFEANVSFSVNLTKNYGEGPCPLCDFSCKLDNLKEIPCNLGNSSVKNFTVYNLTSGNHNVSMTATLGEYNTTITRWFNVVLDAPTAIVNSSSTANPSIRFSYITVAYSKPCVGFVCKSFNDCVVSVDGPADLNYSSVKEVVKNLIYTFKVGLQGDYGRVTVKLGRTHCVDLNNNVFQRTSSSVLKFRFDKRPISAEVGTPVRVRSFPFNGKTYGGWVTNGADQLYFILRFNSSLANTTTEVANALSISGGNVTGEPTVSRSSKRFIFTVTPNSESEVITVYLPPGKLSNYYGSYNPEASSPMIFYDSRPFTVSLSTTFAQQQREEIVGILIKFSAPPRILLPSIITVDNGSLVRLERVNNKVFAADVKISRGHTASVYILEERIVNLVGTRNQASNKLTIERIKVPLESSLSSSLTTSGVVASCVASGLLSLAMTGLSVVDNVGLTPIPSRNLFGLLHHVQLFALTDLVRTPLPTSYNEAVKGIQWVIPRGSLPWQSNEASISLPANINLSSLSTGSIVAYQRGPLNRHLLSVNNNIRYSRKLQGNQLSSFWERSHAVVALITGNKASDDAEKFVSTSVQDYEVDLGEVEIVHSPEGESSDFILSHRRLLSSNEIDNSQKRPGGCSFLDNDGIMDASNCGSYREFAEEERKMLEDPQFTNYLTSGNYTTLFVETTEDDKRVLREVLGKSYFPGKKWNSAGQTLFWAFVFAFGMIFVHLLVLLRLRLKYDSEDNQPFSSNPLSFFRLEIYVILWAIPGISLGSSLLIRGGSILGIIVGAILMILFPLCLLALVGNFIFYKVGFKKLVVFEEPTRDEETATGTQKKQSFLFSWICGKFTTARWRYMGEDGFRDKAFMGRWGVLFENRRGPMESTEMDEESSATEGGSSVQEVLVRSSFSPTLYVLVEIIYRISIGCLLGAYGGTESRSIDQASLLLASTFCLFLYLFLTKPFISQLVQFCETVCVFLELLLFSCVIYLSNESTVFSNKYDYIGLAMLAIFCLVVIIQLVGLWIGFYKQVVALTPSNQEPCFDNGIKSLTQGLLVILPISTCFCCARKTTVSSFFFDGPGEKKEGESKGTSESAKLGSGSSSENGRSGPGKPLTAIPESSLERGESSGEFPGWKVVENPSFRKLKSDQDKGFKAPEIIEEYDEKETRTARKTKASSTVFPIQEMGSPEKTDMASGKSVIAKDSSLRESVNSDASRGGVSSKSFSSKSEEIQEEDNSKKALPTPGFSLMGYLPEGLKVGMTGGETGKPPKIVETSPAVKSHPPELDGNKVPMWSQGTVKQRKPTLGFNPLMESTGSSEFINGILQGSQAATNVV